MCNCGQSQPNNESTNPSNKKITMEPITNFTTQLKRWKEQASMTYDDKIQLQDMFNRVKGITIDRTCDDCVSQSFFILYDELIEQELITQATTVVDKIVNNEPELKHKCVFCGEYGCTCNNKDISGGKNGKK